MSRATDLVDQSLTRLYGEAEELTVEVTAQPDQVPAVGDIVPVSISFGDYGFVARCLVADVFPDSARENVYELTLQRVPA